MIDDMIVHDEARKPTSSLAIISPMSRKHLGVAIHDLDLLEGGMSKEVTDPKIVRSVASTNAWTKCWVRKTDNVFHMYLEGTDAFVMSAIKASDSTFYISQYDAFQKDDVDIGTVNAQNYCAILKRFGRFGYRLVSTSCENCDDRLGRYSCDPLADLFPQTAKASGKLPDRQVLMELSQSVLFLERAGVNARRMVVSLPQVLPDCSRVVWCPRCPRGSTSSGRSSLVMAPGSVPSAARRATLMPGSRIGCDKKADAENKPANIMQTPGAAPKSSTISRRVSTFAADSSSSATEAEGTISLSNRLPKWNDDISSLTMKFLGSRVTASSSKNFLFELPTPEGGVKPVIQFGKLCPATFSLDFRFPLCPVQAFGLFLSANGWTIAKS